MSMEKNKNKPTINKVLKYLSKHYKFVHNEITGQLLYKRRNKKTPPKPFDRGYFLAVLYERFGEYPGSIIRDALKAIYYTSINDLKAFCIVPKYSPRTPINESPFDALDEYIKLADNPPFSFGEMLEYHLVRAIRCVLNGTPNRFIFTLVSKQQYIGKTHFIEWLFPKQLEQYCMSTLSGRKEKRDTVLASKFLCNIDEFKGVTSSASSDLKAMVSQKSAALWVSFKNVIEQRPRITTFFATKNTRKGKAILSHDDDNSRYIIYDVASIDWSYKEKIDIDELWRYAIARAYNANYDAYPTIDEVRQLEAYNRRFTKRMQRYKPRPHQKRNIALGAILSAIATTFVMSPYGRIIFAGLARALGLG